jgi:putative acetyltransferase
MYVDPARRGGGTGQQLLDQLSMFARMSGLQVLRLETGIHQLDAIALYERAGFVRCDPFGDYQPDPLSLFMEKHL